MNKIGLKQSESNELITELNILLSNYQIFYMNVRGFHWNIKGDKFFELHVKFEELYNDLLIKVDELAERVLTLGGNPDHAYSQYLKQSDIQEVTSVTDSKGTVSSVLSCLEVLLIKQRSIMAISDEDEGTNALMSDYIREQEKIVWMYSAFLG